jgi:hypothetical protein
MHIQSKLTTFTDECIYEGLHAFHREAEAWTDIQRLDDLADANVRHGWLWALNDKHGPTLKTDEYVEAVRLRLGSAGPTEPTTCSICGKLADTAGAHYLLCAQAEATRGHNAVRRCVHELACTSDPSAEMEPLGLIPSAPTLRPADVLTTATCNGLAAALDVGITSPHCGAAGNDCLASMYERKRGTYAPHFNELSANGITYNPIVWSAYGRPHEAAIAAIKAMARRTARRRGHLDAASIETRVCNAISVEIWRRNAAMVKSCWSGEAPSAQGGAD